MLGDRLACVKTLGLRNTLKLTWRRLRSQQAQCFSKCREFFVDKRGLEIGGPSGLFENHKPLPIYPILSELDNCLFAAKTVWMSETRQGRNFRYDAGRRIGYQYICDGTNLNEIPAGKYDCVLSCNNLEHIANPLKALKEWSRVLTDTGVIIVVVPAKENTFDHRRSITSLAHLVADFESDVLEDDLSHLDEILTLHDLSRDRAAGGSEQFRKRCEQNHEFRCMHHHVYNTHTLVSALDYVELQIYAVEAILPSYIVAIAKKIRPGESRDNSRFFDNKADDYKIGPFPSDNIISQHP